MNRKLLRKNLILLFLLVSFFSVKAQNFSISGKVTDEGGKAMDGATVLEKGTKNSTLTNQDGAFQLKVSSGKAKLVISYVGHEELEIAVDNKTKLSISLKPSNENLNDVVVIGYATV